MSQTMANNGVIVLVDGYAHIYRSFYAFSGLTNARGEPTNALFAMGRFMLKLDKDVPHEFGAVVMDKGKPARRLEMLPSYKATRAPMPDPLRDQIAPIREWIAACGWAILEQEGQEADDVIAAIVKAREGRQTVIVSHDKDLAQLVAPGVVLLTPGKKGESRRLDEPAVEAKFGVPPQAIVDYLAMVGDNVDNVPGIAGVGPKTAASLLVRFGSIDAMLANTDAIERESLREKVRNSAELLRRNRELVRLDEELPPEWTGLAGLRRREPDWDVLLDMARDNGFKSMLPTLEKARHDARNPTLF